MKVIKAVSDYIIVIKDGRIVEKGTAHNIFNNSNSSYTKELLQAVV
jgi:ABC-type microcin C transport system duplicated ATPase subunit YejF